MSDSSTMEAIKQSMEELSQQFNTKMAEFQQNLSSAIPAASPTSHIAAQFNTFRSFVLSALEGLQLQVSILSKQYDILDMRSRRKILLLHGVPEEGSESASTVSVKVLSNHLKMPELDVDDISRCQRLGTTTSNKPRPILLKFRELTLKNQVWYAKTKLKGTGITLSEFLTKSRHEIFMVARKRCGINKCWTKDGTVIVIGPDGKRHNIYSCTELDNIYGASETQAVIKASVVGSNYGDTKTKPASQAARAKRMIKK